MLMNIFFKRILVAFLIFFIVSLSVVVVCVGFKLFISFLLWLVGSEYFICWSDIWRAVKVSFCGGAVGGVGFSLFHFFKIKGF
ncbi:TPA: hypothetical protein MIM79_17370 [Klebsiella variicola]|nr:hypothetical protein [Klebsiella variicola]